MLELQQLSIAFQSNTVVKSVDLSLQPNEILGLVGESGSGKSVTAKAIMQLLDKKAEITGQLIFEGNDLNQYSEAEFQQLRGREISMIFQEPMSSLNPSMRCGTQVAEILKQHTKGSHKSIQAEVIRLFEKVKLPRTEQLYKAYPHEISGGQKQRVMIAMAIACQPKILIADEPTTALDVTVQKTILELLKSIQAETGMSILFISHDLALVSELADRVAVMYQGELVEVNETATLFKQPKQAYTKALLATKPPLKYRLKRLPTVADVMQDKLNLDKESRAEREKRHENIYGHPPLLIVKDLHKTYVKAGRWLSASTEVKAVNGVNFELYEGENMGLVGESGCGKSTLSKVLLGLEPATKGEVWYKGQDITQLSSKQFKHLRSDIQLIFQDPFSSLNPRLSIGEAIVEPMLVHGIAHSKTQAQQTACELLERVGLSAAHFHRYPHEFSGGQRQRIGIARTIALQPKIVICDESVSALDVSVQAQVLNLLNDLKADFNFTYLFISHDLAVVKYMADQLLVMRDGEIVEHGNADVVYADPQQNYTKELIAAIPKGID
ncbi:peptide/nickel transport system ATP-binding protein [Psychroflexus salarius]|uniref:Peptide/nickel transport system ATP-binding protein n=1 Tax=Psychroflexus salarius TaxID=1155689 RepID=A0A1M4V4M4_9FLAO|nr:ABC transporter ATP-binding protein [Psychroflexus salarius]SHE63879.1 peptide/nickel transport system ATP-binding protein [Psychroflexus salarius]